jgi:hypothetical protein
MNSRQKSRLILCVLSTALLGVVSASSFAGRAVRSDSSDSAFNSLGGFWGTDFEQFGGPSFEAGKTEFKLKINPAGTARFFNVCMGEGFIKLIAADLACAAGDFARPPTGNYIAVFATDLEDGSGRYARTRGFVDPNPEFRLGKAKPAMRFWWNGVTLAGDINNFDVQIVLIDRSDGTNNGNFDIEMNYGTGSDIVPPVPNSEGFQGFKLGPNTGGPTFGPFGPFDTNGAPIRFCFRGGNLRASCT